MSILAAVLSWIREFTGEGTTPFITGRNYSKMNIPKGFNPDELSWVVDGLAITNVRGALQAMREGYFIVNTAEEFHTPDQFFKEVIDPRKGSDSVKTSLNVLAEVIHDQIRNNNKEVVVHCQMGMERSVLAVVWYLHTYLNYSIDTAYEQVRSVRPIAIDHREWLTS